MIESCRQFIQGLLIGSSLCFCLEHVQEGIADSSLFGGQHGATCLLSLAFVGSQMITEIEKRMEMAFFNHDN